MRAWLVPVTTIAFIVAHSSSARAQTAPAQAEQPATASPETSALATVASSRSADLDRAESYKTTGAVLTVFGVLGTLMGTGMVIGRDDNPDEADRGIPIEVGVAAAGVITLFTGIYMTARGKSLEAQVRETAVAPLALPGGLGVGVAGRF